MIEHSLPNPLVLAADAGAGGALVQLLPFILIFGIFYFLLIRPQQRQRRKTQDMLANLKTGDRVVTNGGIHGTIVGFRDAGVVHLQVSPQVKLEVERTAIASVQSSEVAAAREGAQAEAVSKGKK